MGRRGDPADSTPLATQQHGPRYWSILGRARPCFRGTPPPGRTAGCSRGVRASSPRSLVRAGARSARRARVLPPRARATAIRRNACSLLRVLLYIAYICTSSRVARGGGRRGTRPPPRAATGTDCTPVRLREAAATNCMPGHDNDVRRIQQDSCSVKNTVSVYNTRVNTRTTFVLLFF